MAARGRTYAHPFPSRARNPCPIMKTSPLTLLLMALIASLATGASAQTDDPAAVARVTTAAETALRERRFDDAFKSFTELAKRRPQDPYAAWGIGYAAASLGRFP